MAALHKKERAQAVMIMQLKQDLERHKTLAESSTRELADLKQSIREQSHEPEPRQPKVYQQRSSDGGVALPTIGGPRGIASRDGGSENVASRSRNGSAGRHRTERPPSAVDVGDASSADASRGGGGGSERPASQREKLRARCVELEARV